VVVVVEVVIVEVVEEIVVEVVVVSETEVDDVVVSLSVVVVVEVVGFPVGVINAHPTKNQGRSVRSKSRFLFIMEIPAFWKSLYHLFGKKPK
jgi:hypothetical protein